ncbi:unnamed protein product [Sphagnum balticum]
MFPTFFRPKIVQYEVSQNVEWLVGVGESASVVCEEVGRVVFEFRGDFSQEDERLGQHEVTVSFPFDPYAFIGFPGNPSSGAVEKAVLRGFFGARVAHFALGGQAHELKPGANREALIEGEPNEGAHFSWASVVPYIGDGLRSSGVPQIEALDERDHVRGA